MYIYPLRTLTLPLTLSPYINHSTDNIYTYTHTHTHTHKQAEGDVVACDDLLYVFAGRAAGECWCVGGSIVCLWGGIMWE